MELKNINKILDTIPSDVTLVAATKYVNSDDMKKLLDHNINNFGENRVDVFLGKYVDLLDYDINWHFIGHLQRNKAKLIVDKIDYLHSLDSLELAKMIDKLRDKPLKCFIEVNINYEENKNGVKVEELEYFISEVIKYKNIDIVGFMCMTVKESSDKYEQFLYLSNLMKEMNKKFNLNMQDMSMGMSDDYLEAIKAGSTFVRLGRILWM